MNYRQKFYDSYDTNNLDLKIKNSYYHFQNIQKIIYRKPEYKSIKKIRPPKININTQPYQNFFVMRDNELYKKIINDIRSTKVRPKLNDMYKLKEEKLRDYKRQNRTLENRQLSKDNLNFKKRLRNQKSMLRIREMDKNYRANHFKMVDRSKKIKQLRNFILPPISTIVNRIKSPKNNSKYNKYNNIDYNNNSYSRYSRSVSKDAESFRHGKNHSNESKVLYTKY